MITSTARALILLALVTGSVTLGCGTSAPQESAGAENVGGRSEAKKEPAKQEQPKATSAPMQDARPTSVPAEEAKPTQESMAKETPVSQPNTSGGPAFKMQDYQGLTFKQFAEPPPLTIDPNAEYTATLTTNVGTIVIGLFAESAPKTVNNFVFLADDGFYDGLIFHRVIEDFMIQGGDPTGTGTAGPGYKFEDETSPSDSFDKPGLLAMANAGPNTNGSQFFITTVPTESLNGRHTIFGEVRDGQNVAVAISQVGRDANDRPLQPVIIQSIKIAKSG